MDPIILPCHSRGQGLNCARTLWPRMQSCSQQSCSGISPPQRTVGAQQVLTPIASLGCASCPLPQPHPTSWGLNVSEEKGRAQLSVPSPRPPACTALLSIADGKQGRHSEGHGHICKGGLPLAVPSDLLLGSLSCPGEWAGGLGQREHWCLLSATLAAAASS